MDLEQIVLAHEPAIRLGFFVGVFAIVAVWARAGHDAIVIGIHGRTDPHEVARLDDMLLMPFKGKVDGYAINLRHGSLYLTTGREGSAPVPTPMPTSMKKHSYWMR